MPALRKHPDPLWRGHEALWLAVRPLNRLCQVQLPGMGSKMQLASFLMKDNAMDTTNPEQSGVGSAPYRILLVDLPWGIWVTVEAVLVWFLLDVILAGPSALAVGSWLIAAALAAWNLLPFWRGGALARLLPAPHGQYERIWQTGRLRAGLLIGCGLVGLVLLSTALHTDGGAQIVEGPLLAGALLALAFSINAPQERRIPLQAIGLMIVGVVALAFAIGYANGKVVLLPADPADAHRVTGYYRPLYYLVIVIAAHWLIAHRMVVLVTDDDLADPASARRKTWFWIVCLGLFIAYVSAWFAISFPYRWFPSDDTSYILFPNPDFIYMIPKLTYLYIVQVTAQIVTELNAAWEPSTHLLIDTVANGVTLVLIVRMVYRYSRSWVATGVSVVLFALASWPATYYFIASYAPLGAMLTTWVFGLILAASGDLPHTSGAARAQYQLAGFLSALLLTSTTSGLLGIWCCVTSMVLFLRGPNGRAGLGEYIKVLLITTIVIIAFLYRANNLGIPLEYATMAQKGAAMAKPILENVAAAQSVSPAGPWLPVFVQTLIHYNVYLAAILGICIVLVVATVFRAAPAQKSRTLAILLFVIVSYAILIDLLPTTKLARHQFLVFPLVIVFIGIALSFTPAGEVRWPRLTQPLSIAVAVMVIPASVASLSFTGEMVMSRTAAPRLIESLGGSPQIYLLADDPHAQYMDPWLAGPGLKPVRTIGALSELDMSKPGVLVLGPHGPGSGLSILKGGSLPDFTLPAGLDKLPGVLHYVVPYYAYFPAFMMEQENTQAILFRGAAPDYHQQQYQLTIYAWGF